MASRETDIARQWIDALRLRDLNALTKLARYPFELRDTGKEGHCKKRRMAAGPEKMALTVRCLIDDDWLHAGLKDNPEPVVEALDKSNLPAWTIGWRDGIPQGIQPIGVPIDAAGCTFDLVLLVAADGVRGFWKTGQIVTIKEPW